MTFVILSPINGPLAHLFMAAAIAVAAVLHRSNDTVADLSLRLRKPILWAVQHPFRAARRLRWEAQ